MKCASPTVVTVDDLLTNPPDPLRLDESNTTSFISPFYHVNSLTSRLLHYDELMIISTFYLVHISPIQSLPRFFVGTVNMSIIIVKVYIMYPTLDQKILYERFGSTQ